MTTDRTMAPSRTRRSLDVQPLVAPSAKKTLLVAGHEIAFQDPPEKFYDFMKFEAAKWARVVKDSGARVE